MREREGGGGAHLRVSAVVQHACEGEREARGREREGGEGAHLRVSAVVQHACEGEREARGREREGGEGAHLRVSAVVQHACEGVHGLVDGGRAVAHLVRHVRPLHLRCVGGDMRGRGPGGGGNRRSHHERKSGTLSGKG